MTTVPAILKYLNTSNNYNIMDQNVDMPMRAKKRRLDHLSWEEKIQRKKLKNRVAAQTSRDRKKAKMDQMDAALQELFAKNEALLSECENLKAANQKLTEENTDLQNRLRLPCVNCNQNRTVECETQSGSAESLLRPQGTVTHSAAVLSSKQTHQAFLKMVLACLLYQTCSMNSTMTSTSTHWNSSHKVYSKISPETWKQLLKKQILKNQLLIDKKILNKWWGRHQKTWNPVDVKC